MKRLLNEDYNKCKKLINFQKQDLNSENTFIINKSKKEEIDEINNILNNIFEEEKDINIKININTINKNIYINEKNINNEKNRKYKYCPQNIDALIDSIHDDLLYKDIISLLLYVNNQKVFVNKENWKSQLYNELDYLALLENESTKDNELMTLLEEDFNCLELKTK